MGRVPIYKIKDLIKYAYVLPIYALCAVDMAWVAVSCIHGANNPDISWKRRYDEPFNAYCNKTYKFWMTDEYRAGHICRAPKAPCYLTKEEEKQQEEDAKLEAATKEEV